MKKLPILLLAMLVNAWLPSAMAADVSLFITKAGSSSDFSSATPRWWNFTITEAGAAAGLVVVNGNFTIIKEPSATQPVTFSLYSGFISNGTATGNNTLLAASSQNSSVFVGGQGSAVLFTFAVPPSALAMGAYSLTLTTTAPVGSNTAYKTWGSTEQIQFQDPSTGAPLSASLYSNAGPAPTPYVSPTPGPEPTPTPTPTPGPEPTPVPEPGQWAAALLTAFGVGVYLWTKRRRESRLAVQTA
jgi:hypothetical protein